MKLIDWQKMTKAKNVIIAQKIGVDTSYISHINSGRRRPSPDLALKIEKATGGRVTVMELLFPSRRNPSPEKEP